MIKKICSFLIASTFFLSTIVAPNIYALHPQPPGIQTPAAVLMDANSGVVIYSRNMDTIYYPASITKIMSTLLAIELADGDFDQRVHFSHNAVFSIPLNASNIGMNDEETLSLWEALMANMLMSANEVSNAIAEHFSVTTQEFSRKMTERAYELGAVNTNFTNAHGLHDVGHYTTAYDMAIIMREAMRHPEFVEIISTPGFQIPPTERRDQPRDLHNQHRMTQPAHYFFRAYVVGGKTGFTTPARNTLVTYATRDGMSLIAVVLYNEGAARSYENTALLFDYGFNMFGQVQIFDALDFSTELSVKEAFEGGLSVETATVAVFARDSVSMKLPLSLRPRDIRQEVHLPDYLTPPVSEGDRLGHIDLMYRESVLASVPLFAANSAYPAIQTMVMPRSNGFVTTIEDMDGMTTQTILQAVAAGGFILLLTWILIERKRRKRRRDLKIRLHRQRSANRYSASGEYVPRGTGRGNKIGNYRYRTDGR